MNRCKPLHPPKGLMSSAVRRVRCTAVIRLIREAWPLPSTTVRSHAGAWERGEPERSEADAGLQISLVPTLQRGNAYWRALRATTPELQIIEGSFLTHEVRRALAHPTSGQRTVAVLETEEKGSDVNLAVHLLNDAWLDKFDCALIVSNDSDLAEAMKLVRQHHPVKKLGLVFARHSGGNPSYELSRHTHFVKRLSRSVLAACQLPDLIPGSNIHKPPSW